MNAKRQALDTEIQLTTFGYFRCLYPATATCGYYIRHPYHRDIVQVWAQELYEERMIVLIWHGFTSLSSFLSHTSCEAGREHGQYLQRKGTDDSERVSKLKTENSLHEDECTRTINILTPQQTRQTFLLARWVATTEAPLRSCEVVLQAR
jgi:hypothetical protein